MIARPGANPARLHGALRRSELVSLGRRHMQWTDRGLALRIARSKTDSEGKDIGIPLGRQAETCPVSHLRRWVDAAKIEDGALFGRVNRWGRAGAHPMPDSVRLVLARLAAAAGMVGTPLEPISPHGLRAGFITTAYGNGVSDERIMEHTREKRAWRPCAATPAVPGSTATVPLGMSAYSSPLLQRVLRPLDELRPDAMPVCLRFTFNKPLPEVY